MLLLVKNAVCLLSVCVGMRMVFTRVWVAVKFHRNALNCVILENNASATCQLNSRI